MDCLIGTIIDMSCEMFSNIEKLGVLCYSSKLGGFVLFFQIEGFCDC
jgi:hypothetical protein